MTTSRHMQESEGKFTSSTRIQRHCSYCKMERRTRREVWESNCGGYEDEKFTCTACGFVEWVDGIDS